MGELHAGVQEDGLLAPESVFIRKAFLGTPFRKAANVTLQCVVLGTHGLQLEDSISPLQTEERQPWTVCSVKARLLHRTHRLVPRLLRSPFMRKESECREVSAFSFVESS